MTREEILVDAQGKVFNGVLFKLNGAEGALFQRCFVHGTATPTG